MPAECSVVKGIGAEWAEDVRRLLSHSYWAYDRSLETVERSMRGSVCYGAMCGKNLVGFARIVTDGATTAYLCDVIVDEEYRGRGIGKQLVSTVVDDPEYSEMLSLLLTRNAHSFYAQFGFVPDEKGAMRRSRKKR